MDIYKRFLFVCMTLDELTRLCDNEVLAESGVKAKIILEDLIDLFVPVIEYIEDKNDLL